MVGERGGGRKGGFGEKRKEGCFLLGERQGASRRERARMCKGKEKRRRVSLLEQGHVWGDAGAAAWASPKWEWGKQELLPPAGSDPSFLLRFLGSSSTRRAPGRNKEQMARSGVPGTHLDSPCLQAVGAGQGGGGEEDFRSKLNLLENLACSPSS